MVMLFIGLLFVFLAIFCVFLMLAPLKFDGRPTLNLDRPGDAKLAAGPFIERKKGPLDPVFKMIRSLSLIMRPLTIGPLGARMIKDLNMARIPMTPEEFMVIKVILLTACLVFTFVVIGQGELFMFGILISLAIGYYLPEMIVKGRIQKIKDSIVRDLPDTVDLLGLCVNAGLDFMMALKYVVEKSKPSDIIEELKNMIQEINVGKPRRDALRDMSKKYEIPDVSTFTRTLIQADRMGTSVSEALNILSEDMREARFRRGEAMAMKAPLKMLIPLLFCIFPVVAILVAGPVFLDFFQNNPIQKIGGG